MPPKKSRATTALVRAAPITGPSAAKPIRVWRRLALIVPPCPSAGVAATMFGLSSQLALAEFANTPAWTVPNSFTGKRVVDSTFVCASSATCVWSISTAGGTGASAAPAAVNASTFARSSRTSARSAASSRAMSAAWSCAKTGGPPAVNEANTSDAVSARLKRRERIIVLLTPSCGESEVALHIARGELVEPRAKRLILRQAQDERV